MVRLNIGCGPNIFPHPGWINYDRENCSSYFAYLMTANITDEMPEHQQRLTRYLQNGGNIDYRVLDLNEGFPQHPDNSIDGIYLGQMIEHLNPIYEVPGFLKECYRMLKPGGILRIATPDLDLLIKAYLNHDMDKFAKEQPAFYKNATPSAQLAFIMYGACGPQCRWNNYEGHMFLFTPISMTTVLLEAGFGGPFDFYYETGMSKDEIMAREVVDSGMSHSFIVEAIK